MYRTLKKFFDFCNEKERKQFYLSIVLSVLNAMFIAARIPAVYIVVRAALENNMSLNTAYIAAGIILLSIILQTLITMKTTMLQTEAGYNTECPSRVLSDTP